MAYSSSLVAMSTSLSYSIQFATPKYKKHLPYTPPWPQILSIIHNIAAASYRLIVVSYNQTAAT
jgi:hypothetical protein